MNKKFRSLLLTFIAALLAVAGCWQIYEAGIRHGEAAKGEDRAQAYIDGYQDGFEYRQSQAEETLPSRSATVFEEKSNTPVPVVFITPEPTPKPTTRPTAAPTPTPAPARAPVSTSTEKTVYITKTGNKYHKSGCSYLKNSKIAISLNSAKENGYTACSRCNP